MLKGKKQRSIIVQQPKHGVVAIFKDPEFLKKAASEVYHRNVVFFDAFSPFPVHGIEKAMGIKRSFLPWVTFIAGLTGCTAGLYFQIWVSAVTWPLNVGGKPYISLPAFIPVTFEVTVLFAGLATAAALIVVCGLPILKPKILDPRITSDHFALFVSAEDPNYNENELIEILKGAGAHEVRVM